jgi:predicted phosphodiesterase
MSSSAAWKVAFAFFQVSLLLVSVEALLRVSPRSSLRRGLVRATMSAFGPGEPAWTKYADKERVQNGPRFPGSLNLESTDLRVSEKRIKCYVLSDLHADAEKNQVWVRENCLRAPEDDNVFTVFILPGDVGSEIDRLESVFRVLTANYNAVIYCPGNHEAWRRGTASGGSALTPELRADNRMAPDSVSKIVEVVECARNCGVHVGPLRLEKLPENCVEGEASAVTIFPLYSWYHASWDVEPDLENEQYKAVEEAMPFFKKWGDFSMCSWPPELISHSAFASTETDSTVLAEAFASINEQFLTEPGAEGRDGDSSSSRFGSPLAKEQDTVISFSHFLPRQELCPEKRFLIEPLLARVIGSDPLEAQLRRLQPHLHLFGHTHIPIDLQLEGVRYIQWPLGYSREADKQCAPVHAVGPLLVFDSICGEGAKAVPSRLPSLSAVWTQYYTSHPRNPQEVKVLAPWVTQRLDQFSGLVRSKSMEQKVDSTRKH